MPEPLQDADAPEVLKERCEYIYRRILPAVGATAVLSLLLSAFLWPSSPIELIAFWQTAILLIAAGYWALALAYQLGKAFSSAYGLRSAYERLSADNAATQAQLGEQLDSLLEAHREVQAFGRKLALFSERAPIAVFEVDPHATILDMNPAAENLFGYAAPEMVGRNCISMLLNPDDRESTDKWWGELVAQGRPATVVAERCLRRDGLELACEWTM